MKDSGGLCILPNVILPTALLGQKHSWCDLNNPLMLLVKYSPIFSLQRRDAGIQVTGKVHFLSCDVVVLKLTCDIHWEKISYLPAIFWICDEHIKANVRLEFKGSLNNYSSKLLNAWSLLNLKTYSRPCTFFKARLQLWYQFFWKVSELLSK